MEKVYKFWALLRNDPIPSLCGVVFAVCYYITSNPTSVDFLGPDNAQFAIGFAEFLRGATVAVGLLFAAQTKTTNLETKDVIPEVLAENQPEGKEELMSDPVVEKAAPAKVVKKVAKKIPKKVVKTLPKKSPTKKIKNK